MKKALYLILYVAILVTVSCTDKGSTKHVPQTSDSLYTEERAMEIYAKEPQRAMRIIDSAQMVGNEHHNCCGHGSMLILMMR